MFLVAINAVDCRAGDEEDTCLAESFPGDVRKMCWFIYESTFETHLFKKSSEKSALENLCLDFKVVFVPKLNVLLIPSFHEFFFLHIHLHDSAFEQIHSLVESGKDS